VTPLEWLLIACAASVILGGAIGACIAWQIAFDRGFEEACGNKRHRHRIGSPQETTLLELPRAGQLALEPMPGETEWTFFGAQVEPQPGPAEYELLTAPVMTQTTQTMTVTATTATVETRIDETDSAWSRRHVRELEAKLRDQELESDAYIKNMREESNYFRNVMLAADHPPRSRPEVTR
jgi:hypothetical protein